MTGVQTCALPISSTLSTPDENGLDKVEAMKHTYKKLKLSCLVVLGGNGSQKTANMLSEEGLNVVSLRNLMIS